MLAFPQGVCPIPNRLECLWVQLSLLKREETCDVLWLNRKMREDRERGLEVRRMVSNTGDRGQRVAPGMGGRRVTLGTGRRVTPGTGDGGMEGNTTSPGSFGGCCRLSHPRVKSTGFCPVEPHSLAAGIVAV